MAAQRYLLCTLEVEMGSGVVEIFETENDPCIEMHGIMMSAFFPNELATMVEGEPPTYLVRVFECPDEVKCEGEAERYVRTHHPTWLDFDTCDDAVVAEMSFWEYDPYDEADVDRIYGHRRRR